MQFLYFGSLFFSPGQDPKSLKNVSGFSLIRFRSKVTEHLQNCEKTMRSERTEMAFKERTFRIFEFPDMFSLVIYFLPSGQILLTSYNFIVTLESVPCKRKLKFEKTALEKKFPLHKQPPNTFMEISQSFCKPIFLPVTSCENFLAVLHVLAFQRNQLLHHFVGYLRCLLYAHVDFVICNDYGKNKMGTEADLKALRNYRGTTVTACIVSVKTKILAALQSKSR